MNLKAIKDWWATQCQPESWASRREGFKIMQSLGFKVVPHGIVGQDTPKTPRIVVYTNDLGHCGEGKKLVFACDAEMFYQGLLYSEYQSAEPAVSYRLLKIGLRTFTVRYQSAEHLWASQLGDGTTEAHELLEGIIPNTPPIWAVDFVKGDDGELYAVDWNTAPGIQTTGIINKLRGFSIVHELAHYVQVTGHKFFEETA